MRNKIYWILVILLTISLFFNAYSFGYKYIYKRGFDDGVTAVSNALIQQYKQTGQISLNFENRTITLVEKER